MKNVTPDILAFGIIFAIITLSSIPPLASGGKLNPNDDFFQYASRHEAVRKNLLEYHAFPLRSHWFGGGYPTLGDPEDPTLNPLALLSVLFGTVMGLKLIGFLALLVGGLSTYALARYVLGYTRWGALFSGLILGSSLFVPFRIQDGNPNEVYAAFLPLCMLLIGLACRRRKIALLILPFVFYTMLSDGKLTALTAIFYMGVLCLLDIVPMFGTFAGSSSPDTTEGLSENRRLSGAGRVGRSPYRDQAYRNQPVSKPGLRIGSKPGSLSKNIDIRPTKILIVALFVTFLIGMARFLPALELINARGGLAHIDLSFHPKTYSPEGVHAYTFKQLWQETIGWKGELGLVTIGWVPAILFGLALFVFWKKSLPWAINLLLFGWLLLAYNAPVDLLKSLWRLPIFSAIYRPYKYFSFQIAFTFAVASGQSFWLLRRLRPKWLEHLCAVVLITAGVWFLYPKMAKIQSDTYTFETPAEFLVPEGDFYNVQGQGLKRNREEPLRSVTYFNLLRNIGTIDWYTGMPIAENAIPKYFVNKQNKYIPNAEYRGEVSFLGIEDAMELTSPVPTLERSQQFADSGLAGLWHLDLVQDNLAKDSSGRGNSGRLIGMDRNSAPVRGKFGNALIFDGSNWLDIGPTPFLRLDGSYTLSVWVKPFDLPRTMERFILDTDFWRSGSRYALVLHRGFIRFMHWDDGTHVTAQVSYSKAGLEPNRWHHLAAVFDRTHMRLYVDGVSRAETPYARKNDFKEDVSLRIGARTDPPGKECFDGLIDEVAIWNRALTSEEVANIWSLGSVEQPPPPYTMKSTFRPNSITAQVDIQKPGILVINQNYHRDWHTNKGELFNRSGLIALRLRETGSYTVRMRYVPRSCYTGLAISVFSLTALAFICWTHKTGRLVSWSQNAPPLLKRGSQAILWLID